MEPVRLLYLEDDPGDQELTRRHLARHAPHVTLTIVGTVAEARDRLAAGDIDLILSDYRVPDGTGVDLLEAANAAERPVPVVLVTGSGDPDSAVRLLKAGAADYVVKRPGYLETLPAVLEGALRWSRSVVESRRTAIRVLYAEGDAAVAESTRRAFAESGPHFQVEVVSRGREALDRARSDACDVLLVDYRVPDLSGIGLLKALREERIRVPVVMLTDHGHEEAAVQAFKLGAADYIVKQEGYLAKLPSTVEHALAQRRLADERDALLVLHGLTGTIATLQDLDSLIQRVARAATELLRAERSIVWIAEGTELRPVGWVGIDAAAASSLGLGLDAEHVDRARRGLARNGRGVAAPLAIGDRPIGVLAVAHDRPRDFSTTDERLLAILADHAAIAIDNARLYGRLQAELGVRARLTAILEATTDLVWIADVSGRLLYVNRAGRAMLGFGPDESLSSFSVSDCVPEQARQAVVGELIPAVIRDGLWSGETVLLSRQGREIPVSLVGVAHRSPTGAVEFLSTIARDVTERARLEQQLRQAQKMEAVGRLAGGVAHDFNNVLTAISGYGELLSRAVAADESLGRDVDEIRKAAQRAAALTRQLLAFSRQQVLQPKVLDINTVVTDVEKMLRRLIGEDIELVVLPGSGLWRVQADPGQLEQVLLNLAINARDAMPTGGKLTIETANVVLDDAYARQHVSAQPGPHVMLAVSDTGCGMDAETQARIFEPFFTTKEMGKGTGLGLSTVYGIVKQSGGNIWVYSEPGRGTTFKVYLPRVEAPLDTPALLRETAAPSGGVGTILLVEDDAGVRALARRVLQEAGYTVLEARDGEEALRISRGHEGQIALLLTDLVMPGTSGPDVAKQLVGLRPGVKVLFMSGYTDNAILRQRAFEVGTAFLDKPFTPTTLTEKVRDVLDRPRDR